jgi:2-desacetyl-2-hydroxyethyl bacteriochlorophyllide A dehydrogenase
MKALQYLGPESIAVNEVPIPEPDENQVLIKVHYCGVCGSDVGIYLGTHPRAKAPLILGHEFYGEIVEMGANVKGYSIGDRVAANPLITCGKCWACSNDASHVCKSLGLYGIDTDGGMSEYVSVHKSTLCSLPPSLGGYIAALIEPVAVAIHSMEMSKLKPGSTAIVTGAGPIGLLMAIVLREKGVKVLFMTELDEFRTKIAKSLGFEVINPVHKDILKLSKKMTNGEGADCLFEASGAAACALDMSRMVRSRGMLVMLAVHKKANPVNLLEINFKELTLVGTRVYTEDNFRQAVIFTEKHQLQLSKIITHVIPLTEGPNAIEIFYKKSSSLKVVVDCTN